MRFAGLSGEYNAIHGDLEFAKTMPLVKLVHEGVSVVLVEGRGKVT